MKRAFYVVVGVVCIAAGAFAEPAGDATLETVRALVARNEALLDPIRMAYTIHKSHEGDPPQLRSGSRQGGKRYSHINCVWAQSGEKHYAREDCFYGPNEPGRSTVRVFDGPLLTTGKLPGLMEGTIAPRYDYQWDYVFPTRVGLRRFNRRYTLSEVLVPEHASLHEEIELVDGRETYVVDVTPPPVYTYFERIWIDRQRGLPLRLREFDKHPDWDDARVLYEVTDIELHPLPNGGWIPIRGARSINFLEGYTPCDHITVDVNTITTRPENIPASLFEIDFPEGASLYNVFSGLKTVKGQMLKTCEQVVETGCGYIAGTVVDENGAPVAGVVTSPLVVRTRRADGRSSSRLLRLHDYQCAITDARGRFAIESEQEGSYDLSFLHDEYVDTRLRDIPRGTHDLKVALRRGGTVTGRVAHLTTGGKVPVVDVEVTAEQENRIGCTTVRRHRLRTRTDSEGRFQIAHLDTLMAQRGTDETKRPQIWQIRCGSASERVSFEDGDNMREVELVLKPDPRHAVPLTGRALPDLEGIGIDLAPSQTKDKRMLICFFDMNQRPSRNYVMQIAGQIELLQEKGVSVAAVQIGEVAETALRKWATDNNIPFPVGIAHGNEQCVRFDWAVQSLPWLILTDRNHVVRAEGFRFGELEGLLAQK